MPNFDVLEPAIDPNNRISFLLDWELTMKCNLDCSYCVNGLYGGHDNSTKHPKLLDCLETIDFMFAYVNLYMSTKPRGIKYVILNVYGGESLHHPDIEQILQQVKNKYQKYKDLWHLTITTTTNAIISSKKLKKLLPLIDEFTVSYHTESTDKQKQQFRDNLLTISRSGKRQKCVVLMHQEEDLFEDAKIMMDWLNANKIKLLPRQLDKHIGVSNNKKRTYTPQQVKWFGALYNSKNHNSSTDLLKNDDALVLSDVGRACCGGRQTYQDQNYKQRFFYVENQFTDWYCSVNHFFLHIKQINGEVFVNKDCKMNFQGTVGPIGNLSDTKSILQQVESRLINKTMPVIQCKKIQCFCGLCAPKAKNMSTYKSIMEKFQLN